MACSILISLALNILGASLVSGSTVPDGILALPVTRTAVNASLSAPLNNATLAARDDGTTESSLSNLVFRYLINLGIGNPTQDVAVIVDTGSSDLWVFGSSVAADGSPGGYYTSSKSNTYRLGQEDGFEIDYAIGKALGDWVFDDVSLGGAILKDFQFASVKTSAKQYFGTLGIAALGQESVDSVDSEYPNFPVALKQAGYIHQLAYSLYLDSPTAQEGQILFGGVDRSKYVGQLRTVPFTDDVFFFVDFTFNGYDLNGVLDSGTSMFSIPGDVFDDYFYSNPQFNLRFDGDHWITDNLPEGDGITISFSGIDIEIPIEGLFFQTPGSSSYSFGLMPDNSTKDITLVGDTVLRYAYVVYDLENRVAGLAAANLDPGEPDLVVITDGIPGATPA